MEMGTLAALTESKLFGLNNTLIFFQWTYVICTLGVVKGDEGQKKGLFVFQQWKVNGEKITPDRNLYLQFKNCILNSQQQKYKTLYII